MMDLWRCLRHGWPYDIHSFDDVAPLLAANDYRVIARAQTSPRREPERRAPGNGVGADPRRVVVAVGCTGDQAHTERLENVRARSRRCWLRPRRGLPFGDERHALVGPSVPIGPTQLARW